MTKEKIYRAYVIFVRPERHRAGSNYIANDGTVTDNKDNAATFLTHGEALAFAKIRKITLNDVTRYIGQEDFTSREA